MIGQKPESQILERDTRIELASPPWKGGVIPIYQSRVVEF